MIVRLFNTVGPRQSGQYGMVIPRFVEHALSGEPLEIHGDGTQTRSFCHVSDTIRALEGLMDDGAITGEIYNVGSTERIRSSTSPSGSGDDGLGPSSSSCPTTRSTASGSRTCSTGARDRQDPRRDRLAPALDLDRILADVIEHSRRAPVLVEADREDARPRTNRSRILGARIQGGRFAAAAA